MLHCATDCNKICPMIQKNQGSLKKSATSVTKAFYMQYGGSLCNRLQRDLSNGKKKIQGGSKKSATSVTKVFYMQYGRSL